MLIAQVSVPFSAALSLYYSFCVIFSEMDVLDGPAIYENLFKFYETPPFNERFDFFGMGDMNFLMNSASLPIFGALTIFFSIFFTVLEKVAKGLYRLKFGRQMGVYAEERKGLQENFLFFFMGGYIDFALSS